jgi:hypothetical protein
MAAKMAPKKNKVNNGFPPLFEDDVSESRISITAGNPSDQRPNQPDLS